MKFLSLEPFVPSGKNFAEAKLFFQELGFTLTWDAGDYIGFERDACKFILQKYDNLAFAQNLMFNVRVSDVEGFRNDLLLKKLPEKYGITVGQPTQQPYGKEVNVIDMAGVCWHFVEANQ
ncbi:VOC family protein [Rufibacter soli]